MTSNATNTLANEPETSTRTELIALGPAEGLAGVLDIDAPSADDELPALWHWVYLLERPRQSDLGPDGHPRHGIPAPPGPGRLRMFAGGRVSMHTPLRFGEPATRTTRVIRTIEKEGKSGPLTFVTVRSDIEQDGRLAIADERDIVYRAPGSRLPVMPNANETPPPDDSLALDVNSVMLFRFSALTYNAHRIHYDSAYTTQQEGYSGLVVHGPLQALMMGELIRRSGLPLVDQEFAYRLITPAVGEQRLTAIMCGPEETGVSAQVRDATGIVTATSTLRPLRT
jgi:3-methylfumaryl-CoA hydratase